MCILFLAINQHPDYPLIVAANRDEYFARPSEAMHYWPDFPRVLAGRDRLKGGSWLGINQSGQFCAVTNFRSPQPLDDQAASRGELVAMYLKNALPEPDFIGYLKRNYAKYNPFNLVFGEREKLSVFSSQNPVCKLLVDGFHSVSNGEIDLPWPKMSCGVQRLTQLIAGNEAMTFDALNRIMVDETKADESDLPKTGLSAERERALSSIFVKGENYGTRTTSLLLWAKNNVHLREYNYDRNGDIATRQQFELLL